jgi:hypothetical protein
MYLKNKILTSFFYDPQSLWRAWRGGAGDLAPPEGSLVALERLLLYEETCTMMRAYEDRYYERPV